MEKRSNPRRQITTSIACAYFNSSSREEATIGNMKNCCMGGFYAELKRSFKPGTVLVVRATGRSLGYSIDEGFRSQALAEVRWSKPKPAEEEAYYATGMKYLMPY